MRSTAASVKAQIIAENQAKVRLRKLEQRFLANLASNYRLTNLEELQQQMDNEAEAKRIEMSSRTSVRHKAPPVVDAVRCVGAFPADARCLEFAQGGATLWTAEQDGTIGIRNGFDGSLAFRIEKQDDSVVDSMMATETTMWVGMSNGTTRIYDQQVFVLAFEGQAHEASITTFAQSFDEKTFSASEDGSVVKWDSEANSFEVLSRITDFGCAQRCLHCYGYSLFCSGDDGIVRSFDSETSALLRVFEGHSDRVNALTVLDGFLFTASADKTIVVWNIGSGECLYSLNGHDSPITALMCDPVGHHLWSADDTGLLNIWSSKQDADFALIHSVQHESRAGVGCLKGITAIDTVKMWTLGSDGENKVWQASSNRTEEGVREALDAMQSIIEQDEIELAKWADLLQTLRQVEMRLNHTLAVTLRTMNERERQRKIYYMFLRYLIQVRMRRAKLYLARRLAEMNNRSLLRQYHAMWLKFLHMRKRRRQKIELAKFLESQSVHKLRYECGRKLQMFVSAMKQRGQQHLLAKVVHRATEHYRLRGAYDMWQRFRMRCRELRKRHDMAVTMERAANLTHTWQAYAAWQTFTKTATQRRSVHNAAAVLGDNTKRLQIMMFFLHWQKWASINRKARMRQIAIRIMLRHSNRALMQSFHEKWREWSMIQSEKKKEEEYQRNEELLRELRKKEKRCQELKARLLLIREAQEAIDAARRMRDDKLQKLEAMEAENREMRRRIDNGEYWKKDKAASMLMRTVDLFSMLKARLMSFHTDFASMVTIREKCKKIPASKIFLEAHAQIKTYIVNITGQPYLPQDTEWPLGERDYRKLRRHQVEPMLNSIKALIISFDTMEPWDDVTVMTRTEIGINAAHIVAFASRCLKIRVKRFGSTTLPTALRMVEA